MAASPSPRSGAFRGVRCKGMTQDGKECQARIGISYHSGDRIGKVDTDIRDAAIYCKVCKSSIVYSPAELDYFDEVDVRFP